MLDLTERILGVICTRNIRNRLHFVVRKKCTIFIVLLNIQNDCENNFQRSITAALET